jgi:hypothetical protein
MEKSNFSQDKVKMLYKHNTPQEKSYPKIYRFLEVKPFWNFLRNPIYDVFIG